MYVHAFQWYFIPLNHNPVHLEYLEKMFGLNLNTIDLVGKVSDWGLREKWTSAVSRETLGLVQNVPWEVGKYMPGVGVKQMRFLSVHIFYWGELSNCSVMPFWLSNKWSQWAKESGDQAGQSRRLTEIPWLTIPTPLKKHICFSNPFQAIGNSASLDITISL